MTVTGLWPAGCSGNAQEVHPAAAQVHQIKKGRELTGI